MFESVAEVKDDWRVDAGYAYGLYGTPTTRELAARIAELEKGEWTFMTPRGQAAITLIDFTFVDALSLFKIGYSWGGAHSLVMPWFDLHRSQGTPYGDRLVRLNIWLEDADDLIADLGQVLQRAGLVAPY